MSTFEEKQKERRDRILRDKQRLANIREARRHVTKPLVRIPTKPPASFVRSIVLVKPPEPVIPMQRVDKGRHRILLPCGIGDVYWSLVKFQSFCKRNKITDPYVAIITTSSEPKYAGSEYRSIEFLKMVPFVKVDEPPNVEARPTPCPDWLNNIYMDMWHGSRTSYEGFMGYDYFLVYNSAITNGRFLEEVDDLECNWHFPLVYSYKQEQCKADCQRKYGKYVTYLWSFCGGGYSLEHHVKEFSVQNIIDSIKMFTKETGTTPVFVGSWWDVNHGNNYLKNIIASVPGSVDLVGKTTMEQLFGVIRGSEMVVGAHCGPTIMATVFHKKTIIMWARSYPLFKPTSPLVVAPPDARWSTYYPIFTKDLTVDGFIGYMKELYGS